MNIQTGTQAQGGAAQGASKAVPVSPDGHLPGDSAEGGMAGTGAGIGPKIVAAAPDIKSAAEALGGGVSPTPPTAADASTAVSKRQTDVAAPPAQLPTKIPEALGAVDGAPKVGVDGAEPSKFPHIPNTPPQNINAQAAAVTVSAANGGAPADPGVGGIASSAPVKRAAAPSVSDAPIPSLPGRSKSRDADAGISLESVEKDSQRTVG